MGYKKIVNNMPSLSSLLLAGLTLTASNCDNKAQPKEEVHKAVGAPAAELGQSNVQAAASVFKGMDPELVRSIKEAFNLVIHGNDKLALFGEQNPVFVEESDIDRAESDDIKKIGSKITKAFGSRPFSPITTLDVYANFDWESAEKKVSRVKAVNALAKSHIVPCGIAQGIRGVAISGDFTLMDELSEKLAEFDKCVLGMPDGMSTLRPEMKFGNLDKALAKAKVFRTTGDFVKFLAMNKKIDMAGLMRDLIMGDIILGYRDPIKSGERGCRIKTNGVNIPVGDSWKLKGLKNRHLPPMESIKLNNAQGVAQARPGVGPVDQGGLGAGVLNYRLSFGQILFALLAGNSATDCFTIRPNSSDDIVDFKLRKDDFTNFLTTVNSKIDFAKYLGQHITNNDSLSAIFPIATDNTLSSMLDDQLRTVYEGNNDKYELTHLSSFSDAVTTLENGSDAFGRYLGGKLNTYLSSPTFCSNLGVSRAANGSWLFAQPQAQAGVPAAPVVSATLEDGAVVIRKLKAEVRKVIDNSILYKKDGSYVSTAYTDKLRDKFLSMLNNISEYNGAKVITYANMKEENSKFDVEKVHNYLKEVSSEFKVLTSIPSGLLSALRMEGAKGTVNYSRILNMPGLTASKIDALDKIRFGLLNKNAPKDTTPVKQD